MKVYRPRYPNDIEARVLETHWRFTARCANSNPLWFTPWNKEGIPEGCREWRACLFTGIGILGWVERHREWFYVGRWNTQRKAQPIYLTPIGRLALRRKP